MRPAFDWRIEDADPQHSPVAQPDPAPRPRRTRRLVALLALGLLGLAVAAVWIGGRLGDALDGERQALLELVRLEDELLRRGDREGLIALAGGDQADWLHGALLTEELVPAGPAEFGPPGIEGDRAWLDVTRLYRARDGLAAEPFALRLRQHYGLIDGGWRRTAAPLDAGSSLVFQDHGALALWAPPGDAAIAAALGPRLATFATELCAELRCRPGHCPNGGCRPRLRLVLSARRPSAPGDASFGSTAFAPAPAVTGLPLDDAGYQGLYRLYARYVVAAAIAQSAGLQAPPEPASPWVRWELARLGLATPPPAAVLQQAAAQAVHGGASPVNARPEAPAVWLALAFLDGRARLAASASESVSESVSDNGGTDVLAELVAERSGAGLERRLARAIDGAGASWWDYLERVAALEPRYPGGAELAVVCSGQIMRWRAATGTLRPSGYPAIDHLLWSPDGRYLAAATSRAHFNVYDLAGGPPAEGLNSARAWSPDGRVLAVQIGAGRFNAIRYFWHVASGDAFVPFALGPGWAGWSPDGAYFAYVEQQSEPRLFLATASAEEARILGVGGRAAWSPDARYLAFADDSALYPPIALHEPASGATRVLLARSAGALYGLAWAPAARGEALLALASFAPDPRQRRGHVLVLTPNGRVRRRWTFLGRPVDLQWSPDGRALGWLTLPSGAEPGRLEIWDLAGGEVRELTRFTWPMARPPRWGWSPDGRWIALDHGRVTIWSALGQPLRELPPGCSAPAWRPERAANGGARGR
jgi:hypothetical protein